MLTDINIGQHIPGNSVIHNLDPRIKIISTLIAIIVLFLISSFMGFFVFFISVVTIAVISRIPLLRILKGLKPLFFFNVTNTFFSHFFNPGW
ncbi:MAG: hypothetical protein ACOC2G_00660 [Bacillota bacterium]